MSYQSEVLADNPIVYWPLNETSGSTANDLSGNDYTGTHIGAVPSADGVSYDGVDDRTDGEIDTLDGIGSINFPLTYECMIRTSSSNDQSMIDISRYNTHGANCSLLMENGEVHGFVGENATRFYVGATVANDGIWHHIAMVIKSNTQRSIYLDGVEHVDSSGTSLSKGTYYSREFLTAGAFQTLRNDYPNRHWDGELSDVAYYRSALSAARIQAHYDASGLGAAPAIIPPPLLLGGL